MRRTLTRLHSISVLVVGATLISGCSDRLGALTMRANPTQPEFTTSQPVCLQVDLQATEMVCISRDYWLDADFTNLRDGCTALKLGRPYQCGLPALGYLLTLPISGPVNALDVADVRGRFHVISQEHSRTAYISIAEPGNGFPVAVDRGDATDRFLYRLPLEPGEYRVSVRLRNDQYWRPAPLFWSPYSHEARAETIVRILTDSPAVAEVSASR